VLVDNTTAPACTTTLPYQLFRDLPPAIESALRDSIDRFGVLVPVAKDQDGNILDGHQRARLAESLGLKYPVNIIEVADEEEGREIARTLNEDRREMPREQRLPVVRDLREAGYKLADIAEVVGTSAEQVRQDLSTFKDLKVPEKARGKDGKWRPTTYRRRGQKTLSWTAFRELLSECRDDG
jgi:ParB-like chromosome segregation protein Spo0J